MLPPRVTLAACALLLGCFGQGGGGDRGPVAGASGTGGTGGGSGGTGGGSGTACDKPSDCRLVDERCCGCGPAVIDDAIRAVRFDSSDFGVVCDVDCGECPDLPVPVTVVADCVEGRCAPVVLQDQPYAQCLSDADCIVRPVNCCGFCGSASVENSYAVNANSDFQACPDTVTCPAIPCPEPLFPVEAFCSEQGVCSVRVPEAEESCAGLACDPCEAEVRNGPLCVSGDCSTDAECLTPAGGCDIGMGTFTTDFRPQGCVDGHCLFERLGGACHDLTSCEDCTTQAIDQSCASEPLDTCAACCLRHQPSPEGMAPCACAAGAPCTEPCAGTTLCGGATDPGALCASCLREAMRGSACVDDPAFQQDCILIRSACQRLAQCLATCPAQ